jgi:hypothetical protein
LKSLAELGDLDRGQRAADFTDLARIMLRTGCDLNQAELTAERMRASPRVKSVIKAAVGAGTTTNLGGEWNVVSAGFIDSLRSIGVFDALLPSMVRVPLQQRGLRVVLTGITAYSVAEGAPIPISDFNLGAEQLDRLKADAIICVTKELANSTTAAASAMISRALRAAVVAETDSVFLSALVAGAQPVASAGAAVADVITDIGTAMASMSLNSTSQLFIVAAPLAAARLKLKLASIGATLGDITVLASDQLPALGSPDEDIAVLVDAAGIAADTGEVTLSSAKHAAIQMSRTPATGAQAMVSAWQTNSVLLRAQRYFGFKLLRDDAVQVVSGVVW